MLNLSHKKGKNLLSFKTKVTKLQHTSLVNLVNEFDKRICIFRFKTVLSNIDFSYFCTKYAKRILSL